MIRMLFRLPPIAYFVLAPLVLVLGIVLYFTAASSDAERAAALAHSPPAEIGLGDITSAETGNDYNEVVVRAQGDLANTMELVTSKRGVERGRKVFMPLYPADAADFSGPVLAVMQVDENLTDGQLAGLYDSEGPAGPVFLIDGTLEEGTYDTRNAFGTGVTLAPDFKTIRPFVNGREAALSNGGEGSFFLVMGVLIAIFLGLYGFGRKRWLDKRRAREEQEMEDTAVPA